MSYHKNKNRIARIIYKVFLACIPLGALLLVSHSSGRNGYNTGSPGEFGETCTQCHSSNPQDYGANLSIVTNIPVGGYALNTSYNITVDISSSANRHGFLINSERLSDNQNIGVFTEGANSQTFHDGEHVTHENYNSTSWSFTWTSPSIDEGPIKFYAAAVAGNGLGNNDDEVVTSSTESIATLGLDALREDQFKLYPNPIVNDLHINIPNKAVNITYIIYDLSGKKIKTGLLTKLNNILKLQTLQSGIYILQITTDSLQIQRQLIKY